MIVRLTSWDDNNAVYVNADNVAYIIQGALYTTIYFNGSIKPISVRETPEQVTALFM